MNEVADNAVELIFAEEALVVDVQILLNDMMEDRGMSRADLARAMGVTRARVTQMLSDDCKNLTVRLLARAAHALGDKVELRSGRKKAEAKAPVDIGNVYPIWAKSASFDEVGLDCRGKDDRLDAFSARSQERLMAA